MPYKDRDKQRQAQREYAARRRQRNPRRVAELQANARSKARTRNIAIIAEFKAQGCSRCDENDPVALDCHHVRGTKNFTISKRRVWDHSEATLRAELAKCDVLCANCHRKEHDRRRRHGSNVQGR